MRALVDANVFLSFLLHPRRETAASELVRAALAGRFQLLVPEGLLEEIEVIAPTKPYLADRIPSASLRALFDLLRAEGEMVPPLTRPIPPVTRDRKDDYLIAHAIAGAADVLVSGDQDLLTLGRIDTLQILSPKDFLAMLG